jgi:hypothetical protein
MVPVNHAWGNNAANVEYAVGADANTDVVV